MTDTKEWLIRKNGYFYRPNKSGYTLEKAAAGRYTKDDADREAAIEPHNFTVIHESEVEDAPQVVDLSAEITTLRKELAEARAALEPFAKAGRIIDGPFGAAIFPSDDASFQSGCAWSENGEKKTLTWGDFRRAATVLRPPSKAKGEKK